MNPRAFTTMLPDARPFTGVVRRLADRQPSMSHQAVWRRASWVGLVLALLFLQQLGLAHRYVHNAALTTGAASAVLTLASQSADAALDLPVHDKPACLVLDQLCMADAVPVLPLAVPLLTPSALLAFSVRHGVVPAAVLPFQARGPPEFSPLLSR